MFFCNIGWMERYEGLHGDTITGGGTGDEDGNKYELCNFSPYKGYYYGYVQPSGETIDINRLGANDEDFSIDEITVVWTAAGDEVGTVIIGWYQNATVFREYQKFGKIPDPQEQNGIDRYWIMASVDDSLLLPVSVRAFKIPRGKRMEWGQHNTRYTDNFDENEIFKIGQSNIRYTNGFADDHPLFRDVREYIKDMSFQYATDRKFGGTQDQDKKDKVEEEAIERCIAYYKELGYKKVTNVGKLNRGWDLEATSSGKESLNIEVKGLSGPNPSVVLTPNEYKVFKKYESNYRLAVVVNALNPDKRELFICRYSKGWLVERIGSEKNHILRPEDKIFGSIKIEIEPNKQE